jgi:hypothetical protein
MATVIKTYAKDSSPNITFVLSRSDGSPVVLTGATVKLVIQNPITGKHTNDANSTCAVVNTNTVTYAWNILGTDLPVPGIYKAMLFIKYSDGQEEDYGITINAERRI